MCMGPSGDISAIFAKLAQVLGDIKTPEQVIKLFERLELKPVDLVTSLNQDIRDMLKHDPCYDPIADCFPYIPYLLEHGFAYDSGEKRIRGAYYGA